MIIKNSKFFSIRIQLILSQVTHHRHFVTTLTHASVTTIHHMFTFRSKKQGNMVQNHLKCRWYTVLNDEMVLFDLLLTSDRSNFGQIILKLMILELFTHYKCHKPLESNLTWPKNEPNLYFSKSVYPFLHWIIPSQPKGKIHALDKISKTTEGVRGKHFGFKSFSNRLVHMNWVEIFWAFFYMLKSFEKWTQHSDHH